jgi:hypothetical protein
MRNQEHSPNERHLNGLPLNVTHSELAKTLQKMQTFSIDGQATGRTFSAKLQDQQGWSHQFTHRAIEEYKRFMVLAAVSAVEVTPSQIVDEVWHLHLQYTRNYRDEMCGKILGKHIDHNPGNGVETEEARFSSQYLNTLLLYASVFGEAPPKDIWHFSEFDQETLRRGLALKKPSLDGTSGNGNDHSKTDSAFIYFGDTPLPACPWTPEPDRNQTPNSSNQINASDAESSKGFWSSVKEFFGFGGMDSSDVSNTDPASPSQAEVDSTSGNGGAFDALGPGTISDASGSDSSSASSCSSSSGASSCSSSASSCSSGSSCGGGGCGGGGCSS